MDILIRPGVAEDVPALTKLAVTTYVAAFGHSFTPEDLEAHLAHNLAPANIARFIAEDVVLVAELVSGAGGRLAGFAQFGTAGPEYAPESGRDQELRRLYVLAEVQNQGAGTLLMQAALAHPQMQAAPTIYLDVWEHNQGARRFYARHGFEVIGTRQFEVESGAETSLDLVMVRRA
jgi:ribosomal protein S18 acetylase RimI-like enzyme